MSHTAHIQRWREGQERNVHIITRTEETVHQFFTLLKGKARKLVQTGFGLQEGHREHYYLHYRKWVIMVYSRSAGKNIF